MSAARAEIAFNADAHDDRGVFLDLADLAERDIVAEAGQQAGLKTERAEVADRKSRNDEEQDDSAGEHSAGDH